MPHAFQSGCAARARAPAARTSVGPALSSSPRTSPVAGFTEAMRETAISTLDVIWEEVYAGGDGCARGLFWLRESPMKLVARQLRIGLFSCAVRVSIPQQPGTTLWQAPWGQPLTAHVPRGCRAYLPGSPFPSPSAEKFRPGSAPCDEEIRCRAPCKSIHRLRAPNSKRKSCEHCLPGIPLAPVFPRVP